MTIKQEDDGTYCFSFGGMCWDRFPTLAAAQEALYDLERGRMPHTPLFTELIKWIDSHFDDGDAGPPEVPPDPTMSDDERAVLTWIADQLPDEDE